MGWLWLFPLLGGVVLAGVCLYVLQCTRRLVAEADALASDVGAAGAAGRPNPVDVDGMFLTVHILNPIEVACANSRLAKPIAGVSPGLLRRQVYEQMSGELREQLSERGIEAEVDVRRGGS